ncbi:interleukin-1 receptor type 1 [Archocentrus centrarchus]|uniref:interleukin-1 receptor type 1 n=1 Tax=Archocentrus centrarchus TaxID=63155 RepID=UPI0011E9D1DB|nr:interleukin-1 receptor type 1-like [Archocentrus centrarchus]
MRTMAAAGRVTLLTALLSLASVVARNHRGDVDTFRVSAGHLFLLKCYTAKAHDNVIWSRGEGESQNLPAGVEVRDKLLWFLPAQISHNGPYTCEKRNQSGALLLRLRFWVSVSSEECPETVENISITKGVSESLPCKQNEIFRLNSKLSVRWMKDCSPVQRQGEPISVDKQGNMRLPQASEEDNGKYTCLIDVSLNGRKYNASRSILLTVKDDTHERIFVGPQLVTPEEQEITVKVGLRAELQCLAYIGFSEDNETLMYWTFDNNYIEDIKEISESEKIIHEGGKVYALSILSIPKVHGKFLNVPFECHLDSLAGEQTSMIKLKEANHSSFYMSLALCLSASLAVLVLAACFFFFRVHLILAYRNLLAHFPKQQVPDGKLYDAYVSFLHYNTMSSDEVASFAMQILPEKLEEQYGYALFIRGRDDCPGEAMHETTAGIMQQCRRLIIILSSEGKTEGTTSLHDNQSQLWYEQKIGLYDALTKNDLRVILVEIGGPVDYSHLPESLRYIKRKQGALKWNKHFFGTHKLSELHSKGNFWKNLRYHMPPVPARRLQTIV